jgi:hypothetical protein
LSAKGKEPQPKVTERFIYVSLLSKFVRPGLYLYVADMNNCLGLSRKIVILNSSKPPTPREGKQIEVLPTCSRVLSERNKLALSITFFSYASNTRIDVEIPCEINSYD